MLKWLENGGTLTAVVFVADKSVVLLVFCDYIVVFVRRVVVLRFRKKKERESEDRSETEAAIAAGGEHSTRTGVCCGAAGTGSSSEDWHNHEKGRHTTNLNPIQGRTIHINQAEYDG